MLKINSLNIGSSLTFAGITADKRLNTGLFAPNNRIISNSAGRLYIAGPFLMLFLT